MSRLPVEDTDAIPSLEKQIHDVQSQFSAEILSRIKSKTAKDVELKVLREVICTGWPETRSEAPSPSRPYWNYRDEFSIEDGLIVKGERIVIPASMIKEILEKLHAAHQGAEKMKLRTRSAVFWNRINKDIDQTSKHCTECQEAQPRQTREELKPTDIPPYAWHTVGADLFFLDNADYLIVADYYSKYPFVYKLPSTESTTGVYRLLIVQYIMHSPYAHALVYIHSSFFSCLSLCDTTLSCATMWSRWTESIYYKMAQWTDPCLEPEPLELWQTSSTSVPCGQIFAGSDSRLCHKLFVVCSL